MGAWGTGLYSGDFAMDLRSMIRAVARLPFPAERLIDVLCDAKPGSARAPEDPDHTVFWLVTADQFWKRGIDSPRVRETALSIIDEGRDRATMTALGMGAADLRRREKVLAELRGRLVTAAPSKARPTLKQPQRYVMEIGDCCAYPTSGGDPINPYFPSPEKMHNWRHDGWSITVIISRGRAFDFLTWYQALTIGVAVEEKPRSIPRDASQLWVLRQPGTLTPLHMKRMRLERLGSVTVDPDKLDATFPGMKPGVVEAINDISIANNMHVGPHLPARMLAPPGQAQHRPPGRGYPTILGLAAILDG